MRYLIAALISLSMSFSALAADPIVTQSTSNSTVNSNSKAETTVKSPPPSAISPSINSSNSDLCTVGVSGAVQTQILGLSTGQTVRDLNCERLKNAKVLYDMGMKVAAVSVMCQDPRVFKSMMMAGTPCPYEGKIGAEAAELWASNLDQWPTEAEQENRRNDTLIGALGGVALSAIIFALTGGF
jgi:hypothetical protein